jgi:hypothetical protein
MGQRTLDLDLTVGKRFPHLGFPDLAGKWLDGGAVPRWSPAMMFWGSLATEEGRTRCRRGRRTRKDPRDDRLHPVEEGRGDWRRRGRRCASADDVRVVWLQNRMSRGLDEVRQGEGEREGPERR